MACFWCLTPSRMLLSIRDGGASGILAVRRSSVGVAWRRIEDARLSAAPSERATIRDAKERPGWEIAANRGQRGETRIPSAVPHALRFKPQASQTGGLFWVPCLHRGAGQACRARGWGSMSETLSPLTGLSLAFGLSGRERYAILA